MSFLPSQQRIPTISATIACTKLFVSFLNDIEGCELLTVFEQTGRILFHVQEDSLVIEHEPMVSAQQIMDVLQRKWHEISMRKAVHLSLLHQQCTHSQTVILSVPQAAMIWSQRCLIIREAKIVDILVDLKGTVSWFGQIECVNLAAQHIGRLLQMHFPKEPAQSAPEGYGDVQNPLSSLNLNSLLSDGFGFPGLGISSNLYNISNDDLIRSLAASMQQQPTAAGDGAYSHLLSQQPEPCLGSPTLTSVTNSLRNMAVGAARKRERIYFMVPSTDAPRLIGTRGVNKKRIEEQTGCAITLHTESKKDGEFPVEINGSSLAICERAKQHIEKFLMSNGSSDDKKERNRPKVHLEFSPRKQGVPTDSSTPKKEFASELECNW